MHSRKTLLAGVLATAAAGAAAIGISVSAADTGSTAAPTTAAAQIATSNAAPTTTPIKHVVVLYDENVSFDHYFGTYPYAQNRPGETPFTAAKNTPSVNGLNNTLLEANPNEFNPQRLSPSQALTCDQNHDYTPEQSAFDGGLMDKFVQNTQGTGCTQSSDPDSSSYGSNGIVMDYYDGNTVTGLWNLAQHFTLGDNFYGTQFGPSSPGAVNVISGDTSGAVAEGGTNSAVVNGTLNGDTDPYYDECSNGSATPSGPGEAGGQTAMLQGLNIGDLLNEKSITWGWFQGGFTPSSYTSSGQPICDTSHTNIGGASVADYVPHHEPFQYYKSTSNPMHLSPDSVSQVGTDYPTGVNHQYDLSWFNQDVADGNMPAVSYLKAPAYEDGHAGYSDPIDEQRFIVDEVDAIEKSPEWASTAIFITYDDSDGWYDHQMGPIIRGSRDAADTLNGAGVCGPTPQTQSDTVNGSSVTFSTQDRCGVGPRLPLLVISPWANVNSIDSSFAEQASIPAFIEDNWSLGRIGELSADSAAGSLDPAFDFNQSYGHAPAVILNPTTGEVEQTIPATAPASTPTSTTSTQAATPPSTGVSSGTPPAGHGGSSPTGSATPAAQDAKVTMPAFRVSFRATRDLVHVTGRLTGGSNVSTFVRMRIESGRRILVNQASTVRAHRVTFLVRRGTWLRSGHHYRVTMTVDADGAVAAHQETLSLR